MVLGNRRWLDLNGFKLSNEVNQIIVNNESGGLKVTHYKNLLAIAFQNVIKRHRTVTQDNNT